MSKEQKTESSSRNQTIKNSRNHLYQISIHHCFIYRSCDKSNIQLLHKFRSKYFSAIFGEKNCRPSHIFGGKYKLA